MNELDLLRDALPVAEGPSAHMITAGRACLLMAGEQTVPEPSRLPSRGRRLVLAGMLGTALVAGATVVVNVGLGVNDGLQVANARELGDRAAVAAERTPYRTPRLDQWIYKRTSQPSHWDMNTWWTVSPGCWRPRRTRTRVDGNAFADYFQGKFRIIERKSSVSVGVGAARPEPKVTNTIIGDGPMFSVRNYGTLPTDPKALLNRLRTLYPNQVGATTDSDVFDIVNNMLADPLPSRLRAALFRLLPTLQGVTLQRDAVDATGRKGIGFALVDGWQRKVIIVDPRSYRFFGGYDLAVRDYHGSGDSGTVKKGTYVQITAVLDSRIVNEAGQRT